MAFSLLYQVFSCLLDGHLLSCRWLVNWPPDHRFSLSIRLVARSFSQHGSLAGHESVLFIIFWEHLFLVVIKVSKGEPKFIAPPSSYVKGLTVHKTISHTLSTSAPPQVNRGLNRLFHQHTC